MTLTKKQQRVLDAIQFLIGKGESPTVREIGALVGLRSTSTVQKHLDSLEDAGVIERRGRQSRGIRLAQSEAETASHDVSGAAFGPSSEGAGIPLVGRIAAGQPLDLVDDAETAVVDIDNGGEYPSGFAAVGIEASLFVPGAQGGDVVALRVVGESMVDCGILDGDMVIIRRQERVEEGEVAAVSIDGAGTLKRWRRSHGASAISGEVGRGDPEVSADSSGNASPIELHPANERFPVIELREEDGQDVRVFGKYVGLIRGAQV